MSRKLFTDSKKVIPSGVNSPVRYFEPYPFFTKKANGAYIWDEDNKRYTDFCNAYGALLLGCLLYTSPSPRDKRQSRMPSSA